MNEFPIDYLPKQVREYIIECSEEGGLIKDYLSASGLSMLSVLLGNNIKLKVSPHQSEPTMLWIALVGNSGTRKTPSINVMLKPLEDLDKDSYSKYKLELKDYLKDDKLHKPTYQQLIVDDVTMESLINVMEKNDRGLLMKKDELLALIGDNNRYSNGGSAEQKLLSMYSQAAITVNRKQNDEVTLLNNPFLSLIGGIQPKLVKELFKNNREHSGFVNRILFAQPENIKLTLHTGNYNKQVKKSYFDYVKDVYSRMNELEDVHEVKLSSKALVKYRKWAEDFVLANINDSDLQDTVKATISKLDAVALRIALIIECSHEIYLGGLPYEVSLASMQGGIEIAEYFYLNFLSIFNSQQKELPVSKKEFDCQNAFIKNSIHLLDKKAQVCSLLHQGFPNGVISKTLGIPKSTISGYTGR